MSGVKRVFQCLASIIDVDSDQYVHDMDLDPCVCCDSWLMSSGGLTQW